MPRPLDPRESVASDKEPANAAPAPSGPGAPGPDVRRALGLSARTTLAIQVINTVSGIELARGLGVNDRGALAAAMLWPTIAAAFGGFGIAESMTYHAAREKDAGRLIGSGLGLVVIQSVVFQLIAVASIPLVLSGQSGGLVVSALIYTFFIPLSIAAAMLNAVLNGQHRYAWANWVRLAIGLAIITGQTILLILDVMSVRTLIVVFVGCYAANLVWVAVLVARTRPGRIRWDRETARRLFAYGVRGYASNVTSQVNQKLDQLLISIFLSNSRLGLYVVAVTLTTLTVLVGGTVAYATLPNVASLPEGPERTILARRLVSLTLALSATVSVPVLVLAPELISLLFGASFADAGDVARILLAAAIPLSTNRALEAVLRGVGRPLDAGIAELLALGVTVVSLAALLPTLGLIGAALSSLVAYGIAMTYMTRRVMQALGVSALEVLVPDRQAVTALHHRVRAMLART